MISVLVSILVSAAMTSAPDLAATLRTVAADSLVAPLRRLEADASHPQQAGVAALVLGRLHFARGEYRQAADVFTRATATLEPPGREEARYWAGVCWLALRTPNAARAAFEGVAASTSPRRDDARFGLALAWEAAERPDRAYETLEQLLAGKPGEIGAAALERFATLADRLHHADAARRARARLIAQYPRSLEAMAATAARGREPAREAVAGAFAVEVGTFASVTRARALATRASRSGFAGARVVTRGEDAARAFSVRLGAYATEAEARRAGEEAARGLGVSFRLVRAR